MSTDAEIIPLPGHAPQPTIGVWMHPTDVVELARLRGYMANLERATMEFLTEMAHLRLVAYEARRAMDKVEEHERTGWERITNGAFDELRKALGRR